MKLLRMYVRPFGKAESDGYPGSINSPIVAELLAQEFPEVASDPLDWERLFDPQLDVRVQLDQMVSLSLQNAPGRPLYTDGLNNRYAVVTQSPITGNPGWFLSFSRDEAHIGEVKGPDGKLLPPVWDLGFTIHLVLHDDDQAERIKVALAELNPEARRFLQKGKP